MIITDEYVRHNPCCLCNVCICSRMLPGGGGGGGGGGCYANNTKLKVICKIRPAGYPHPVVI